MSKLWLICQQKFFQPDGKHGKTSYIKPIFKKASRSKIQNYRGVAILSSFGELLEAIVCWIVTEHLKGVVSISQHGFIKGRSTSSNLLAFTSRAIDVIESGLRLDDVYTDFSKAFDDIVRHSILIKKLAEIGVHSTLLLGVIHK